MVVTGTVQTWRLCQLTPSSSEKISSPPHTRLRSKENTRLVTGSTWRYGSRVKSGSVVMTNTRFSGGETACQLLPLSLDRITTVRARVVTPGTPMTESNAPAVIKPLLFLSTPVLGSAACLPTGLKLTLRFGTSGGDLAGVALGTPTKLDLNTTPLSELDIMSCGGRAMPAEPLQVEPGRTRERC